uniref:Uncharacterized protein n=2 Tax=Ditylenchus dipsaci TaxID=166011 RepID=A0A915EHP9_9BILA
MALQTSMDIFCGSELAFQNTYFACKHSRTVHINTDAPVQSLVSTEVSQSAGSFSFPSEETEFANRFIIWPVRETARIPSLKDGEVVRSGIAKQRWARLVDGSTF